MSGTEYLQKNYLIIKRTIFVELMCDIFNEKKMFHFL